MVFYIFYVKLEFPDWVLQHMALFLLSSGGLTKEFSLFCLFLAEVEDLIPMEEQGKHWQGRDGLSKHRCVQHKSHFGSNSGDLVILRLQARIVSTSEMNCAEVLLFTKQLGYI